jgi:hypothetical protein
MTANFDDQRFRQLISNCLEQTRKVLLNEKQLTTIDKVPHKYMDKYLVADYLGVTAIVCYLNCLSELGLSAENLSLLVFWSQSVDVTLRLEVRTRCTFVKENIREVESPTVFQTEGVGYSLTKSKVITIVTEYLYKFSAKYELVAYRGVLDSPADRIVLQSRSSGQEILTSRKTSPYSGAEKKQFDLNISWLLHRIDSQSRQVTFCIDRDRADCYTPSRNEEVSSALTFFKEAVTWSETAFGYFKDDLFDVQESYGRSRVKQDLSSTTSKDVYIPVFPLVSKDNESPSASSPMTQLGTATASMSADSGDNLALGDTTTSTGTIDMIDGDDNTAAINPPHELVLSAGLVSQLLSEQARSLKAKLDSLSLLFPPSECSLIISVSEGKLLVVLHHLKRVALLFQRGVLEVENMLRNQLVASVGKTLQPCDFTAYMTYHNRKLFKDEYQPRPFSHAVRRTPQHSPEGSIRIEMQSPGTGSGTVSEPIYTACCSRSACDSPPMQLGLNASTNVTFGGDRHLHTWLGHSFSGQAQPTLKLLAQARQFSSFIVLVGCLVSAHEFKPKYGMIVRNKDEITIPLDLEQIPTRKEFQDAIESMSPEQQRFAKAFRGMQLESTLFGVLVLQIKPQLETVLKLSTDALTKEIELTQKLLELFIDYQIPSDLLSVNELDPKNLTATARIKSVQSNVNAMNEMIQSSKSRALAQTVQKDVFVKHSKQTKELATTVKDTSRNDIYTRTRAEAAAPAMKRARWDSESMFSSDSFEYGRVGCCAAYDPMDSVTESNAEAPISLGKAQEEVQNKNQKEGVDTSSSSPAYKDDTDTNMDPSAAASALPHQPLDYTKYPSLLDRRYEELDPDSALRPTIIRPGSVWSKKFCETTLSSPVTQDMKAEEQNTAKCGAFDLLDALSNSGALVMHNASLHVVIAATHCFDKSLMDTVVQGNVNPIERVERSALIMASTIHELPASHLISANHESRVLKYSPQLLCN